MSYSQASYHLRRVKLFIPSSQAPLLTTYGKFLLPKLSPMKEKYKIFSKRSQYSKLCQNPEPQYLSAVDVDKLNRSYEAYKKSAGTDIKSKLKETEYHLDPLYSSFYKSKDIASKNRANSQRRRNFGSSFGEGLVHLAKN